MRNGLVFVDAVLVNNSAGLKLGRRNDLGNQRFELWKVTRFDRKGGQEENMGIHGFLPSLAS